MKVIIAGGRDFNNYDLLKSKCDYYLSKQTEIEVVCGLANGADLLGKQYAEENGYCIKYFPANWNLLGKKAGFVRNKQMAEYADVLIAFWDGNSKGTKHMIDLAKENNLKIKIIKY